MAKKYFLFDCETGGLDPSYSLLTLFGGVLDSNFNVIETIDLAIKPSSGKYIVHPMSMKTNKIDLVQHDAMAVAEKEAAGKLRSFLCRHTHAGRLIPAGHNVRLDLNFAEVLLPQFEQYVLHRAHDTASIASLAQNLGILSEGCSLSLPKICEELGIDSTGLHNAQIDFELTRQVMIQLEQRIKNRV